MATNILYIGKFFPKELLTTLTHDSKGKASMSNHNFEQSIINGLCYQQDIVLKCISVPSTYSYPYNNRRFYTNSESYDYQNTHIQSIGFCNLPIIKEIWSTVVLFITLLKYFSMFNGERIDVIINTPSNILLSALYVAKLFTNKHVSQTVIVPDIPAMITTMDRHNAFMRLLLYGRNKLSMEMTSRCDGLVLLTEEMMDFVGKPLPHIVMEGIVDISTMDIGVEDHATNREIILYTGTLRKIFGIMNLVEAFQIINHPNVELWICGSGDSKADVELAAHKNPRIKFWGLVDSITALKLQRQATILVNPRTSEGEYTKYSFPSKTMEYLLSGKTTIINKLPGIPNEYYDFAFTPKDETVESLAQCILEVLSLDRTLRATRAAKGKHFIVSQKNSKVQTARIINLIHGYEI